MTASNANPFSAPKPHDVGALPPPFTGWDAEDVKSRYMLSRNLRALGMVYILLGVSALAITAAALDPAITRILLPIGLGLPVAGIGYVSRARWGNIAGLVVAVLFLLGFVISLAAGRPRFMLLLFGVVGVQIFVEGKRLFGKDRITHKALEAAYKRTKR